MLLYRLKSKSQKGTRNHFRGDGMPDFVLAPIQNAPCMTLCSNTSYYLEIVSYV